VPVGCNAINPSYCTAVPFIGVPGPAEDACMLLQRKQSNRIILAMAFSTQIRYSSNTGLRDDRLCSKSATPFSMLVAQSFFVHQVQDRYFTFPLLRVLRRRSWCPCFGSLDPDHCRSIGDRCGKTVDLGKSSRFPSGRSPESQIVEFRLKRHGPSEDLPFCPLSISQDQKAES